jgi:hypothetical protein
LVEQVNPTSRPRHPYNGDVDCTITPPLDRSHITPELGEMFGILDVQATMWLSLESFQAKFAIPTSSRYDSSNMELRITSLSGASDSLENIFDRMYYLKRLASISSDSPVLNKNLDFDEERKFLISELETWDVQLESFLRKQQEEGEQQPGQNEKSTVFASHKVAIMRLNQRLTLLMLRIYKLRIQRNIDVPPSFNHEFESILSLARPLLRPVNVYVKFAERLPSDTNHENTDTLDEDSLFHFRQRIIHPLFYTAVKCNDDKIAQDAIDLLSTEPWREGAWDSAAMANIAIRSRSRRAEFQKMKALEELEAIDTPSSCD